MELPDAVATRLLRWNAAMALLHGAFVVATLAVAKLDLTLPLVVPAFEVVGPQGDDATASSANRMWVEARSLVPSRHALHISMCALAFSALSAGFHAYHAFVAPQAYLRNIAQARCPTRWLEYALSAPLMAVCVAYVTGTTTTDAIVAIFGLVSTTMLFGHLSEELARPADDGSWTRPHPLDRLQAHCLGWLPYAFFLAMVLQGFARVSTVSGTVNVTGTGAEEVRMPEFVYAIVASQLTLFSSFGVVQLVTTLRPPSKYYQGELAYMSLSLVAKGLLSGLLLTNVIAIERLN